MHMLLWRFGYNTFIKIDTVKFYFLMVIPLSVMTKGNSCDYFVYMSSLADCKHAAEKVKDKKEIKWRIRRRCDLVTE